MLSVDVARSPGAGPTTIVIGSIELLYPGYPKKAGFRIGARSRRTLALVVALGLLFFAAEEARAQQLPQPQQPLEATGEVTGQVNENLVVQVLSNETVVVEKLKAENPTRSPSGVLHAETPPMEGSASQVPRPLFTPPAGETVGPGSAVRPEPAVEQPARYGTGPPLDTPAAATGLPADTKPVNEQDSSSPDALPPMDPELSYEADAVPRYDSSPMTDIELAPPILDPAPEPVAYGSLPEPVAFDESEPLSSDAWRPPAPGPLVPDVVEEEAYLLSNPAGSVGGAAETIGDAAAGALASLFTGTEASYAPASYALASSLADDAGHASAGSGEPMESPLKDSPQPVSPFAPPAGGSSFSLSSSTLGPGGLALLLVCVLASGFVLSWRDGRLSLALFESLKPDSAFRLPLERPG